jgi:hypothetical protein
MPLNCLLAAASLCPCRTRQHPNSIIPSQAPLPAFNHIKTLGNYLTTSLHHISNSNTPEILREPHTLTFPPSLTEKISRSNTITLVLTAHSPPTGQRASTIHFPFPRDGSSCSTIDKGLLMGLKGFGTGSDRKMEREEVEVDLGLEVALCTAGVVVQARGSGVWSARGPMPMWGTMHCRFCSFEM